MTNDLAYLTGAPVRGLESLNNQDSPYYKDFLHTVKHTCVSRMLCDLWCPSIRTILESKNIFDLIKTRHTKTFLSEPVLIKLVP